MKKISKILAVSLAVIAAGTFLCSAKKQKQIKIGVIQIGRAHVWTLLTKALLTD